MDVISWIYRNSLNNRERYVLGEDGDKTLVCIGINPSTAEPDSLDNTLRQVKSRALALNYDSWIMINVYPQRATNPNDLDKKFKLKIHKANLLEIKKVLKGREFDIWAAWGTLIEKRSYLFGCLKDIYEILGSKSNWFTIGKRSIKGHPHHPLYLRKDLQPDSFDVEEYIYTGIRNI